MLKIILVAFLFSFSVFADDYFVFKDDFLQKRFMRITKKVRCLSCKRHSLYEASASNPQKQEIYQLIQVGKSDEQIITLLIKKHGEIVTYDSKLTEKTLILWSMPIFILIIMGSFFYKRLKP